MTSNHPDGIVLGQNQYGKAGVRLVRVDRSAPRHRLSDLSVTSQLRGDFTLTHTEGDNAAVVTTDTQKNTVFALAQGGIGSPEEFGIRLAEHFTSSFDWVTGGRWAIESYTWDHIPSTRSANVSTGAHDHSFVKAGTETRTALVSRDGPEVHVFGGLQDLSVLKTTGSEFHGFPRDRFTTLAQTRDRILATAVSARWRYLPDRVTHDGVAPCGGVVGSDIPEPDEVGIGAPRRGAPEGGAPGDVGGGAPDRDDGDAGRDYNAIYDEVRRLLLETFADVHSLALQQTLYEMGRAVLTGFPQIAEIRLSMPNLHHFLVDFEPFGLENPDEIYFAADRPYGLIEAEVRRDSVPPDPQAWASVNGFS